MAMFSTEPDAEVQFILSENTITIRKNDNNSNDLGIYYTNTISKNIQHKPNNLILRFNSLGETQKTKINLSSINSEALVNIYSTGYIE